MYVHVSVFIIFESVSVCLIEGLADKLKSLLQMLSIPSVRDSVSFHQAEEGKNHENRYKDVGE